VRGESVDRRMGVKISSDLGYGNKLS
jgi:hypothetical protein